MTLWRVQTHMRSFFSAAFWMNPQYQVSLTDPDSDDEDETATIVVGVLQKETRKMKRGGGAGELTIGYTIYEVGEPGAKWTR